MAKNSSDSKRQHKMQKVAAQNTISYAYKFEAAANAKLEELAQQGVPATVVYQDARYVVSHKGGVK